MQRLGDIPELSGLGGGGPLVRIPMQQDVPFTDRVRAIVDTPEFQRLGQITQLGLASRVYPGATHTRFEHALGVFHNALRFLSQLSKDPAFVERVDAHQAEVLMVAALLHDLGHWPFCHPIEDMCLPDLPPHEAFAAEFLSTERDLGQVLREQWAIEPEEVLDVLVPKTDSPSLRLIRSILSGPIDIDKMDYLERDSLHAGVPYGRNFDRHRLIQSLVVNGTGDGLAISSKGRTAAELMVFARYVMFSEVYWHHAVRSATCMFARSFYELHREIELTPFFQQSESETIRQLRARAVGTPVEKLLEGIFGPKRRLYKRVVDFSLHQNEPLYRQLAGKPYPFVARCAEELTQRISRRLHRELTPVDLLIDSPPVHREAQFEVDVYFSKEGVYRPLHEVSPVIDVLARDQFDDYVKRVRIFADPEIVVEVNGLSDIEDELSAAIAAAATTDVDSPRRHSGHGERPMTDEG